MADISTITTQMEAANLGSVMLPLITEGMELLNADAIINYTDNQELLGVQAELATAQEILTTDVGASVIAQQALDTTFDNLIDSMTQADPSSAEMIDARTSGITAIEFDTIGDRLDDSDTQLADIVINVKNYGATGDGTTDDTVAIQAAVVASSITSNSTLFFPKAVSYCVDESIIIPPTINVTMDAPIKYTGSSNIATLAIGTQGILCERKTFKLDVIRTTVSDWTNEACIAIKLINPDGCDIIVKYAHGHTIGVQLLGSGAGCAANHVKIERIRNCKLAIDLTNEYYSWGKGWCNENQVYGGYLTHVGGFNPTLSRYGIRIGSKETDPAKYEENNNNVFYKPCIELGVATPGESVGILLEHASYNSFHDVRNEGNGTSVFCRTSGTSTENTVQTGYGTAIIEELSTYPLTFSSDVRTSWYKNYNKLIYDSGPLFKNSCYYSASAEPQINIANIGCITSTTTGVLGYYTRYSSIFDNYVEAHSGYGFGISVDTSIVKSFDIDVDAITGYGGRINIKCLDANGTVLTSAGANHPYVKYASTLAFIYNSGLGGVYGTGVDHSGPAYINLHTDVKSIIIYITSGAAYLKIRSLKIYSNSLSTTAFNNYTNNNCFPVAAVTPVFGTYKIGKYIDNAAPTVGQPKGWRCTVTGTMGTLNTGATTGDITIGAADLTVNSVTGLAVGNYITIVGVTGIKRITIITGLVVTLDSVASATVTGAAVAYSNGTFVSIGNL